MILQHLIFTGLPGATIHQQNNLFCNLQAILLHNSTLIISTYNWPDALDLCLQSVINQTVLPGEVIIADDGSKEETTLLIKSIQKTFPVPLKHIWHKDDGFRLATIRNKAIVAAEGDYIIQVDGDLILHPNFIEDHLQMKKPGFFVTGSRVLLAKSSTENLLRHKSTDIRKWVHERQNRFNEFRSRVVRKFLSNRYKINGRHRYYVKGCNMAFWRKDLMMVNGYNESFTGWGREDSELAIRLINAGLQKQFIKMGGVCYHLYHHEASRELESRNISMMQEAIENKRVRAEKGLDKYFHTNTEYAGRSKKINEKRS
jgi:glycosyltransferase involved in cell wall biosynthesis